MYLQHSSLPYTRYWVELLFHPFITVSLHKVYFLWTQTRYFMSLDIVYKIAKFALHSTCILTLNIWSNLSFSYLRTHAFTPIHFIFYYFCAFPWTCAPHIYMLIVCEYVSAFRHKKRCVWNIPPTTTFPFLFYFETTIC